MMNGTGSSPRKIGLRDGHFHSEARMKTRAFLLALPLLFGAVGGTAAQDAPDSRPGIAVFPFENGGSFGPDREDFGALQVGLQQMLLTELAQNAGLRIVERTQLRALLDEQDLGATGRVDPATASRIGQLVGARYIITGSFIDLWGDFRMDARIIDGETSEILKTEQVRDDRENLYELLIEMSGKIVEGVNLPPLPVEVREARLSREIPPEAVTLFSRAQVYQDGGQTDRAIQLYRQIADRFPEMIEAQEALRQLDA